MFCSQTLYAKGQGRSLALVLVSYYMRNAMQCLTLSLSGSTVPYVVERIVAQGEKLNHERVFLPTGMFIRHRCIAWKFNEESGFQSKELIVKANLRLGDVDQYPNIDVTIDGADE